MTDEPQSPTPSAADDPATADWTGVGTAFRTLGRALSGHAKQAGGAVSAARQDADNAADQVSSAFKAAVDHLDAATTDPAVSQATRTATARLLDAIKAELTGEPRTAKASEPEPPAAIDPAAG